MPVYLKDINHYFLGLEGKKRDPFSFLASFESRTLRRKERAPSWTIKQASPSEGCERLVSWTDRLRTCQTFNESLVEVCAAALTPSYYGTSEYVKFLTMLARVYTLGRITRGKLERAERYYEEALRLRKFHVAINLDPEVQLDPNLAEKLSKHAHMRRTTAKRLKDTKSDLA